MVLHSCQNSSSLYLPVSNNSLREEERAVKGRSSTFIPRKFCLSLAIIFKDDCLFLHLRVAGIFMVGLKFFVIVEFRRRVAGSRIHKF